VDAETESYIQQKRNSRKDKAMSEDKEHHNLVSVFECGNDFQAEIIISFLNENGIEAFEGSNLPHSVYPVSGDAQILVNEEDAHAARKLLNDADRFAKANADQSDESDSSEEE